MEGATFRRLTLDDVARTVSKPLHFQLEAAARHFIVFLLPCAVARQLSFDHHPGQRTIHQTLRMMRKHREAKSSKEPTNEIV